jgi:hypothetical protein
MTNVGAAQPLNVCRVSPPRDRVTQNSTLETGQVWGGAGLPTSCTHLHAGKPSKNNLPMASCTKISQPSARTSYENSEISRFAVSMLTVKKVSRSNYDKFKKPTSFIHVHKIAFSGHFERVYSAYFQMLPHSEQARQVISAPSPKLRRCAFGFNGEYQLDRVRLRRSTYCSIYYTHPLKTLATMFANCLVVFMRPNAYRLSTMALAMSRARFSSPYVLKMPRSPSSDMLLTTSSAVKRPDALKKAKRSK